jgi:predicted adenylyl cyclase CyaB
MVKEIELKAHVRDSEALRNTLSGKAEYSCAFEKRDVYWFGQETGAFPVTKLRVRKEQRTFADGTEEALCLVTYKAKEVNNGIEMNDELEFEVCPAEAFEEFLKKAGLKPGAVKRKRGWAFTKDVSFAAELAASELAVAELCAELVEVDSLGWFIELEICVKVRGDGVNAGLDGDDKNEETFKKASETLLAFLDDLGIEREAIERRFYLDLLSSENR